MTTELTRARRSLLDWPFRLTNWVDGEETIRVEEVEDTGALVIRAELPGIDPDKDVDVTVDNGILTVRAERRATAESEHRGVHRSEFRYGSFSRSIVLPPGTDEDEIKATYANGILEVRLPLTEPMDTSRRVPVTKQ